MHLRRLCALLLSSLAAISVAQRREPHNYDLLDVRWHLSYDEARRTIHGDVTNTIAPTGGTSVWFDCGPLDIDQVTVDGTATTFKHDGEKLTVQLPTAGKQAKVRIVYSGMPSAGVYFVSGEHAYPAKTGMVYTQGEMVDTRYWLPTYDWPDDRATLEGFIDVPPGQYALSNGKLLGIDKQPTVWTYHWLMDKPMSTYLISFVAGDYSEGREHVGRLPVLWYVPRGTETWGAAAFSGTDKMIDAYNKVTGFKYPYDKFSQAAVGDFMFGGMENVTCVTQTINTLHKPENNPIADSRGLVAHELAHQWFGDTVTCSDWGHAWLNEGFATFLPPFYFRAADGAEVFDEGRYDIFQSAIGSQMGTKRPVVSFDYKEPIDQFDGQIYPGGAARLFTLMNQLGEKTFWKGVNAYLNEFKYKNVTTEDFFGVMSRVSGKDLSKFNQQFFYTAAVPSFTVTRRGASVVITQPEPTFDLDMKLSFLSRNDIEKDIPVHVTGVETVVDAKGLDDYVPVLDYRVETMSRIRYDIPQGPGVLKRIWWLSPNVAGRLTVLERIENKLSDEDLLDMAKDESSPLVLARLIGSLRANAVPYLIELTEGENRIVAFNAVSALGKFMSEPKAVEQLNKMWHDDPNEFIQLQALKPLLKAAKDESLAMKARSMESQGEMLKIAALDWWAEHNKSVARERCLDLVKAMAVEPLRNHAIFLLGQLKDASGERRVFDTLYTVAQEPTYGSRMGAVNALVAYGDRRALPVIEPLTKSSLHFMRRGAAAAVEALKKQ